MCVWCEYVRVYVWECVGEGGVFVREVCVGVWSVGAVHICGGYVWVWVSVCGLRMGVCRVLMVCTNVRMNVQCVGAVHICGGYVWVWVECMRFTYGCVQSMGGVYKCAYECAVCRCIYTQHHV